MLGITALVLSLAIGVLPSTLPAQPDSAVAQARAACLRGRAVKDSLFARGPDSPIPAAIRMDFTGLRYFPYDARYRVPVALHVYGRSRVIQVPATNGGTVEAERYGVAVGQLQGTSFRLQVYRVPGDQTLEIFFADATSGRETYGSGRYLRLEPAGPGNYVLDFNGAYNPYCAYNARYVCALPPEGNRLPVPVRAGEKLYRDGHGAGPADPADR